MLFLVANNLYSLNYLIKLHAKSKSVFGFHCFIVQNPVAPVTAILLSLSKLLLWKQHQPKWRHKYKLWNHIICHMSSLGWGTMNLPRHFFSWYFKRFAHSDIVFSSRSTTFISTTYSDASSRQHLSDISLFVVVLGRNLK